VNTGSPDGPVQVLSPSRHPEREKKTNAYVHVMGMITGLHGL